MKTMSILWTYCERHCSREFLTWCSQALHNPGPPLFPNFTFLYFPTFQPHWTLSPCTRPCFTFPSLLLQQVIHIYPQKRKKCWAFLTLAPPPPISSYPLRINSKETLCPSLPVSINAPFSPLILCVTVSVTFRALSTFWFVWPFTPFLLEDNPWRIHFYIPSQEYSSLVGLFKGTESKKLWTTTTTDVQGRSKFLNAQARDGSSSGSPIVNLGSPLWTDSSIILWCPWGPDRLVPPNHHHQNAFQHSALESPNQQVRVGMTEKSNCHHWFGLFHEVKVRV